MPGSFESGMLEDLCIKTVQETPAMECVDGFIHCVQALDNPPRNMAKAKAQAYLAAMPKITSSVGVAAMKNYWNFDSDELFPLKQILSSI